MMGAVPFGIYWLNFAWDLGIGIWSSVEFAKIDLDQFDSRLGLRSLALSEL
jgi:hypothetical protein